MYKSVDSNSVLTLLRFYAERFVQKEQHSWSGVENDFQAKFPTYMAVIDKQYFAEM